MPETGSWVHIYFPTDEESGAIAVHAIRVGDTQAGYTQKPDYKSFSNVNGAELQLGPESASVAAEQAKSTAVYLNTSGNACIKGKEVTLRAEGNLSIGEPSDEDGGKGLALYL